MSFVEEKHWKSIGKAWAQVPVPVAGQMVVSVHRLLPSYKVGWGNLAQPQDVLGKRLFQKTQNNVMRNIFEEISKGQADPV